MSFTRLQGMMNTIPQHIKHTLFAARPWEAPLEKSAWHSHGKDLHLVIATFWLLLVERQTSNCKHCCILQLAMMSVDAFKDLSELKHRPAPPMIGLPIFVATVWGSASKGVRRFFQYKSCHASCLDTMNHSQTVFQNGRIMQTHQGGYAERLDFPSPGRFNIEN